MAKVRQQGRRVEHLLLLLELLPAPGPVPVRYCTFWHGLCGWSALIKRTVDDVTCDVKRQRLRVDLIDPCRTTLRACRQATRRHPSIPRACRPWPGILRHHPMHHGCRLLLAPSVHHAACQRHHLHGPARPRCRHQCCQLHRQVACPHRSFPVPLHRRPCRVHHRLLRQ